MRNLIIENNKIVLRFFFLMVFVMLSSCVIYSKSAETAKPVKRDMIACENPRPEMCTRDFRPVCSLSEDGVYKTYAAFCNACMNKQVKSYYKGVCNN